MPAVFSSSGDDFAETRKRKRERERDKVEASFQKTNLVIQSDCSAHDDHYTLVVLPVIFFFFFDDFSPPSVVTPSFCCNVIPV